MFQRRSGLALYLGIALGAALASLPARAASITVQGTIGTDDAIQLFNVTVATAGVVDIRSYGYAGGTTSIGTVAPRGGFDTILTLFDSAGIFLTGNDDGAGTATDPLTGLAADARITTNLGAGSYILALTQYDSFSIGDLADGFAETGNPNFTADPGFALGGACPGNMFRDISGTAGRCRTGNWTMDFVNVSSVTPIAAVPEPSALLLAALGLGLLLVGRCHQRRKATALACGFMAALVSVPVHAQTKPSPDYGNVSDFLNGQRTLLKITDLMITAYDQKLGNVYSTPITTSNSQLAIQTQTRIITYAESIGPSFSALMYAQPDGTTITPAYHDTNTIDSQPYLDLVLQTGTNTDNRSIYVYRPLGANDNPTVTSIAAADFTLDGYDDLAVSLNDGRLLLATPNDVTNTWSGFRQSLTQLDVLGAIAAGDFKGDEHREIAGLTVLPNGGLKLVVYTVDPNSLAVTLATSLTLTTPGVVTPLTPITHVSMARGRFNAAGHDQLGLTFATSSGAPTVEIVDFQYDAKTNTLTPSECVGCQLTPTTVNIPDGFLQLKTGKFALPDNPYDQIVFHISSTSDGGRFFQILSADPTNFKLIAHSGVTYNPYPCSAGLEVGNFDHRQGTDPDLNGQIAFMYCNNITDDNGNRGYTMNIYSVDPTTLNVNNNNGQVTELDLTGQLAPRLAETNSSFPSFGATDLQGRSVTLGEPAVIDLTSTDQPSVVVGAPPMHVDFVSPDPLGGAAPRVMNLSAVPEGFKSTYENDTSDEHPHSESHKTSWSFGASESFGYKAYVGDVENTGYEVGDKFTATQKLKGSVDNITNTFQSYAFSLSATSALDDVVTHNENDLRIWVYPIIGQTVCPKGKTCPPDNLAPLTIQFSAPATDNSPITEDSQSLSWYQPPWEPGNIFSYPANLTQLQNIYLDPNTHQTTLSKLAEGNAFATDGAVITEKTSWTATSATETDTSFNQNYSFENDFSVTASGGEKGVGGASFSGDFDLSGSVGFSHPTTDSTKLGISTGLAVNKPGTFLQPEGNYKYYVSSYVLGTMVPGGVVDNQSLDTNVQTFGQMRAVFTADPLANGAGGWWQQAYNQAPDVALNHPARWKMTTPGLSNPIPSNCLATGTGASQMDCMELNDRKPDNPWLSPYYQMRGFFISSANAPGQGPQLQSAKASDSLMLQARVYNYSLKPMDSNTEVHVRFYFTPWNGTVAAGPSVLIQDVTANPIPPFDDSPGAPPNWVLVPAPFNPSQFDQTKDGNVHVVFWVVVWMQDKSGNIIGEMPGHGLTAIPPAEIPSNSTCTSLFCAVSNVEESQSDGNSYSNNLGFYKQLFYLFPPSLGAPSPLPSGSVDIGKIDVSAHQVTPRDNVVLSATLSASGAAASGVSVNFYDGDPKQGGRPFATERIPHVAADGEHMVQTLYRSNTCGVHQLFAVVNRGKPSEVVRRAQPVRVACNAFTK